MISRAQIQAALAAADAPIMLESAAQVSRAAKAWRRSPCLGLDTEFVRERTYFANLGLVQVSDGHTVWLVEPLAEGTLEPLRGMLEDQRIEKVLHGPSEDLEVLWHAVGAVPDPMVDTQLACAMTGQPLQLGYPKTAEWLLDVTVEKELTRSNWCARPLKAELLHYAALDVCLLPLVWSLLRERLEADGRLRWLREDCARQLEEARQTLRPADAWQRIKGMGRLDGASLAVLQSLAAWREREARRRNRPRGFVVPDNVLLAIAKRKTKQLRDLEDFEDLHPRARARYGQAICERVTKVLESGKELPAPPQLDTNQRREFKRLRRVTEGLAGELGIEPALLATRKDLEELVLAGAGGEWPARLQGWRRELLEPVLGESAS